MKTDIYCFGCEKNLRVPAKGGGTIVCPYCKSRIILNEGKIIKSELNIKEEPRYETDYKSMLLPAVVFVITILFLSFKDDVVEWYNNRNLENGNPSIELVGQNIHVYNLYYTVGITGINEVNSNLADFDELVWDKLRGIGGTRVIIRHISEKDRYGYLIKSEQQFGSVNLDELDRFRTYDDFKSSGGFYTLFIKH